MNSGLHPQIPAGPAWHFSFLNLSVADLIVVGAMIVVFILALIVPFPGGHEK